MGLACEDEYFVATDPSSFVSQPNQKIYRHIVSATAQLRRIWLGPIYPWAGEYRSVNIGKGGFQFAHAPRIASLMAELERDALRRYTPCQTVAVLEIARALAEVHAELILVHPFRDGNGRLARLLMLLMALQAGLPPGVELP
jgi:cell filamentation protein